MLTFKTATLATIGQTVADYAEEINFCGGKCDQAMVDSLEAAADAIKVHAAQLKAQAAIEYEYLARKRGWKVQDMRPAYVPGWHRDNGGE